MQLYNALCNRLVIQNARRQSSGMWRGEADARRRRQELPSFLQKNDTDVAIFHRACFVRGWRGIPNLL